MRYQNQRILSLQRTKVEEEVVLIKAGIGDCPKMGRAAQNHRTTCIIQKAYEIMGCHLYNTFFFFY